MQYVIYVTYMTKISKIGTYVYLAKYLPRLCRNVLYVYHMICNLKKQDFHALINFYFERNVAINISI